MVSLAGLYQSYELTVLNHEITSRGLVHVNQSLDAVEEQGSIHRLSSRRVQLDQHVESHLVILVVANHHVTYLFADGAGA